MAVSDGMTRDPPDRATVASQGALWDAGITAECRWAEGPKSLEDEVQGREGSCLKCIVTRDIVIRVGIDGQVPILSCLEPIC